ncbi:MAG: heme o synthase [Gemmatimonadota bacterium]
MSDWLVLTKARITTLVLVTTAAGYVLGARGGIDLTRLALTLLGTALASAGAAALNQVVERGADALMRRTASRPVAAGRITPRMGLAVGLALSAAGVATLAGTVNVLTATLGLATIVLYLGAYTPLKRRTELNTLVGAVPGAIPPVMGWTAATGSVDAGAWALFAILYLWQLPHFLAIAWMYREDYARAGFPMLPVVDPGGKSTARQVALATLALVPVSLVPTVLGLAGAIYFFGALALGVGFAAFGLALALRRGRSAARRLLLASVTYLPALFFLLVLDRTSVP